MKKINGWPRVNGFYEVCIIKRKEFKGCGKR